MHVISSFYSNRLVRVETIISGVVGDKQISKGEIKSRVVDYINSIHPVSDRKVNGVDTLNVTVIDLNTLQEQATQQAFKHDFTQKVF